MRNCFPNSRFGCQKELRVVGSTEDLDQKLLVDHGLDKTGWSLENPLLDLKNRNHPRTGLGKAWKIVARPWNSRLGSISRQLGQKTGSS